MSDLVLGFLSMQQRLNFFPLPHGQDSLRPVIFKFNVLKNWQCSYPFFKFLLGIFTKELTFLLYDSVCYRMAEMIITETMGLVHTTVYFGANAASMEKLLNDRFKYFPAFWMIGNTASNLWAMTNSILLS